jgi:hypothetical protein
MACAPAVGAFKRKMKAKRSRWRKAKEAKDVASTVKGRASVCFDSGLGLTSALEGLSAAELPLPRHAVFSSSLDSIEPALSRRGHPCPAAFNRQQRKSRSASSKQSAVSSGPN